MFPADFVSRMKSLLAEESPAFFASYDNARNVGLRLNPLKAGPRPVLDQFHLTPVPWAQDGYYYDPAARPGLWAYHEAGLYYLQEPSAMAPAELLAPQPGDTVLDLCAAPGGKSTQIAAKLQGRGLLICNEIHPARAKILSRNIERLGVSNALVLNETPARLAGRFPEYFDKILVDAPCSGEGMFRKEEAAVADWSLQTVALCAQRQLEILRLAAQMLRPGGRLVYSTCTFSPEENEAVVSQFLKQAPDFSIEKVNCPWFSPGRPDWIADPAADLEYTVRLWPHKLRGEGHFAAVLRREGGSGMTGRQAVSEPGPALLPPQAQAFFQELGIQLPPGTALPFGQALYLAPPGAPDLTGLKTLRPGLALGQLLKNRFEPAHGLALWLKTAANTQDYPAQSAQLRQYLHGEALPSAQTGWTLITVDGVSLGWAKGAGGMLKNHYPKGLRLKY